MKKCLICDVIQLNSNEVKILDLVPVTSKKVFNILDKKSVKQALAELRRMEKLGILIEIKKDRYGIVFDKNGYVIDNDIFIKNPNWQEDITEEGWYIIQYVRINGDGIAYCFRDIVNIIKLKGNITVINDDYFIRESDGTFKSLKQYKRNFSEVRFCKIRIPLMEMIEKYDNDDR